MKRFLFTAVSIALCFSAFSQTSIKKTHPSSSKKIVSVEATLKEKQKLHQQADINGLFERNTDFKPETSGRGVVEGAVFVDINADIRQDIISNKSELISLRVPFGESDFLTLDLYRKSPFADDLIIRTSDGRIITPSAHVHYQGVVRGIKGSIAGVTIHKNEIIGVISTPEHGSINIGKMENDPEVHVIFESEELEPEIPFECHTDKLRDDGTEEEAVSEKYAKSPGDCVRIYVELDHNLYQNRGSNIANCEAWVAGVFNNVGIIYTNEEIEITVSEIFIWTTPDSYSTTSANTALSQFRSLRNSSGFNGNLAHLCARGGNGLGGVAYLNSMCTNNRYAYSNVNAGFNNYPAYSWTIMVVSHEMGHNIGSQHTQWCGWPGGAIDNCYETEGSCPPGPPATGGGTVMSYCHLTSAGINLTKGFGPLPGNRIRDRVNQVGCLDPCDEPDPCVGFTAELFVENTSCGLNNGSLEVSISGGSAPFNIDFGQGQGPNTSSVGLAAGTYEVQVEDINGCSLSFLTQIQNSEGVEYEVNHTIQVCEGGLGEAEIVTTSGVAPFTYNIGFGPVSGNIFQNLEPGLYVASVTDANGCITEQSFAIEQAVPIAIGYNATNTSCGQNNGEISFAIFGGSAPFLIDIGQGFSENQVYFNLSAGTYHVQVIDAMGCEQSTSLVINGSEALTATTTFTNTSCGLSNGSINIQASGGTGTFTYNLNTQSQTGNSFSNLAAGTYAVSVSDEAGCSFTQSINIQGSTLLAGTIQTNNGCVPGSGSLNVQISSGTPSYTYNFGNGPVSTGLISNLNSGNYNVQVTDAAGCTIQLAATISNPQPLVINTSSQAANCGENNGTVQVSISGGNGPFLYNIGNGNQSNNTFNNLSAGNYQVVVTDINGCSSTAAVQVNSESALQANTIITGTSCGNSNGSVTLQVSGGLEPFTYQLGALTQSQNIFNNLSAGQYNAIVTDATGCSFAVGFQIAASQAIDFQSTVVATSCGLSNGSASITPISGAQPFIYTLNGIVQNSGDLANLASGTYNLQITDQAGCKEDFAFTIGQSTAVNAGIIQVKSTCENANGSLTIVASGGTGNYEFIVNGESSSQNVFSNLPMGSYNIQIIDNQGCMHSTTAIIENLGFNPVSAYSEKYHGQMVRFTNKSQHEQIVQWTFGDGTSSNEQNPTHIYDSPGEYEVCLITTNECGKDTLCTDIEVLGYALCVEMDSLHLVDLFTNTGGQMWLEQWDLSSPYDLWQGLTFSKSGCLEIISLPNNDLEGEIPAVLNQFTTLRKLDLRGNQLNGTIPAAVGDITTLEYLDLSENNLVSSIPSALSNLNSLKYLYLNDNNLEGKVPEYLDPLKLEELWLHNNNFSELPEFTFVSMPNDTLANFRFENNRLTFEDILPNIALFEQHADQVIYAPQQPFYKDTTLQVPVGFDIDLNIDIDPEVSSNVYSWEKSGSFWNSASTPTLSIPDATGDDDGVYQLFVSNPFVPALILESRLITVLVGSTSTQELEGFSLQIYPNPVNTSGKIYLQWNSHTTFSGQLTWLSMGGQIIDSQELNSSANQELLHTSTPSHPGLYILQIKSDDGKQNHYRIAVF